MNDGKYKARATDVGLGVTEGGNEQIAVLFEILEGESTGDTITWYGHFTEKTSSRTIESLRHCGWQGNDLDAIRIEDLPNEVQIVIEIKPDQNGDLRTQVRWVNRLGNSIALKHRLEGSQAKSFAQRMKAVCLTIPADARSNPTAKAAVAKAMSPVPGRMPVAKPLVGTDEPMPDYLDDDCPL